MVYKRGKPCVIPGAPEGFNKNQDDATKMWEDIHKSKRHMVGIGSFDASSDPDDTSFKTSSKSQSPTIL